MSMCDACLTPLPILLNLIFLDCKTLNRPKPNIFIWDAVALTQGKLDKVINFKSPLLKGICDLAFSPSGKRLVAAAIDVDHNIAVFNVDVVKGQGSLLAATKSGPNLIISLSFVTEDVSALA